MTTELLNNRHVVPMTISIDGLTTEVSIDTMVDPSIWPTYRRQYSDSETVTAWARFLMHESLSRNGVDNGSAEE